MSIISDDIPGVEVTIGRRSSGPTIQELLDDEVVPVPWVLRQESFIDLGNDDLPADHYYSKERHELEVEHVWKKTWQMACREEDIPEVGDTIIYTIADSSLLVVRVAPDRIKAYHNSCLHRGRQLRVTDGAVPEFRCPYHGFTWSLEGGLVDIPCEWDFPHIDRSQFGLPEALTDTWGGWVFINMDLDAGPLHEYLGDFVEHWKAWPMEEKVKAVHVVKPLPCNWKVAMEAFIESYHVIATHPQILLSLGDANTEYDIYPGQEHWNRMITATGVASPHITYEVTEQDIFDAITNAAMGRGPDEPSFLQVPEGMTARRFLANAARLQIGMQTNTQVECTDSEAVDSIEYYVFPNFVPWGAYARIVYRFRPNGNDPESSIMDVMLMSPYPEGNKPPPAKPHHLTMEDDWCEAPELGMLATIFNQDTSNLRAMQRGLRASAKGKVTLANYQESRIRHYHQALDRWIDGGM